MNHFLQLTGCTLAALVLANGVAAETAGTVLFAQPGTQIVGETGVARAAVKGDVLQTGERLVTPAGSISQVVLPDGSLIGMRPESELKITPALAGSGSKAPVVGLISGTARVIGAELMDNKKISNFTLQSGAATVSLKGADLESAVVKPDGKPTGPAGAPGGAAAPGSYQRLLVGTASVANGNQVAALAPQQVNFVGGANAGSVTLATPAQNVFGGNRSNPAPQSGAGATHGATPGGRGAANISPVNSLNVGTPPGLARPATAMPPLSPMAPNVTNTRVPVTVPAVRPCTRFIGKTCVQ
ncbi:FecR domain-containing protein [Rhodoferax sp. AJA081-3]|uniref:FecR domain-containing protein n=1 Tax=Rhodoferax sp. AJA081-3 TaxID=2752316 RepID=UPI001AE058E4|nr:FecR domain-containing protein [Rhodoferax sp. AJA081-3]QTN29949.1 FecR domain-containing protein [Rhodoferax sp. AJA081-3]